VFARLPEPAALADLAAVAARFYGAPSPDHVVAAPGTQILLPLVAALVPHGRAVVLGPTYAEHAHAAALAGHRVTQASGLNELVGADLAILVNPNNPDGRLFGRDVLVDLAAARRSRGLLVIDEAFMEAATADASLAADVGCGNVVVLRSFGKFFGLAGLRLGFAVAEPKLARQLAAALGPWAVSGPAIAVGTAALADTSWTAMMRKRLADLAGRLDRIIASAGLVPIGETSLFRLVQTPRAGDLFHQLGRAGIWIRRFDTDPTWLRFGLPQTESAWKRLAAALGTSDP
jgi:cobalamin biosynthesis protein CobC